MRKRRGVAQGVEVRDVLRDLPPVVHKEKRGQYVRPHLGEHHVVKERAQHNGDHHKDANCGQQAPSAANPEGLKVNAPALLEFVQKKARDNVAGDHKEHGDAK